MSVRMISRSAALVAAIALLASPAVAPAASTATGTLTVTASVAKTCTVSNATLAFGAYDPVFTNLSAPLDGTTTITVTCTTGSTGVTLTFDTGANSTSCGGNNCMSDGAGDFMNYGLFSDSGHSTGWSPAVTEDVSGGTTTPATPTIFGEIPGGQDIPVGSYTDSVVATANY